MKTKVILSLLFSFVMLIGYASASTNLLSNPSFENGDTLATNWYDEHTTAIAPVYSLSTTEGVVDGTKAQKIVYTGEPADDGTKVFEIYQAPVTGVKSGDNLTFSVYINGTLINDYAFIGIESFDESHAYIGETDKTVTTLSSTPTQYSVNFTCPANTNYVAVYMQVPEIYSTSVVSIELDNATLVDNDDGSNTTNLINPVANFTANVSSGVAPLTIQFTNTSTGAPTTLKWDFGDGNTSNESNPVYTYYVVGNYSVTLNVSNGTNYSSTVQSITVTNVSEPPVTPPSQSTILYVSAAQAGQLNGGINGNVTGMSSTKSTRFVSNPEPLAGTINTVVGGINNGMTLVVLGIGILGAIVVLRSLDYF